MLGAIAAILITVWYYNGASESGRNPVHGAVTGFLVYFVPALLWTFLVTPGLRDTVEHDPGLLLGLVVRYGFVVVGVGCAVLFHYKVFTKPK